MGKQVGGMWQKFCGSPLWKAAWPFLGWGPHYGGVGADNEIQETRLYEGTASRSWTGGRSIEGADGGRG